MTQRFRRCAWAFAALTAAGLLSSCNFFNPSGTGSYPSDDADALIDLGQRALQNQRFGEAFSDFSGALRIDSSKSLAYQGLAKAEMGKDSFSIAEVVKLALFLKDSPSDSLLVSLVRWVDSEGYVWDTADSRTDSTSRVTNLYRPLERVASYYNLLHVRDSLGGLDGAFPSRLVDTERVTINAYSKYFTLIDANLDTVITKKEVSTLRLLSSISSGSVSLNLDSLGSSIDSSGNLDSTTTNTINSILTNAASISSDTALLNKIASVSGTSSSGLDSTTASYISQLGASTSFYLINDTLDNDGDGCINEEIAGDGLDNDGDSLVEEDGRVGISMGTPVGGSIALFTTDDGFHNDRFAISGDSLVLVHGKDDSSASLVWSGTDGLLKPYVGLRWVRWDAGTVDGQYVGNDTIYHRVMRSSGIADTTLTPIQVQSYLGSEEAYKSFRSKAIVAVRQKVLAKVGKDRATLGKKIVGGCWDNVN